MKKRYLMTIDAGTGSGRAVIFDENGEQISIAQEEWSHPGEKDIPGAMNFDWEDNWRLLSGCIGLAISRAGISASEIAAVTATSMREGIVLYDADGKEIFAVANVDARAGREVAELKDRFPDLEKRWLRQSPR